MGNEKMEKAAKRHTFTLLLKGLDVTDVEVADALHAAGCNDALFGTRDSVQYADFDREAENLAAAVASAISQIESVANLRVLRVEPDDLVTASVIANRTGRSRESVRLLIEGKRGPGGFPAPIAWVDAKTRLWEWSNVVRWLNDALGAGLQIGEDADFLAALNAALEVRRRVGGLRSEEARAALAQVLP